MVSIRRKRLIKLYGRSPLLDFPSTYENEQTLGSCLQNTRFNSENIKSEEPEPSVASEPSSPNKLPVLNPVLKRRKRHSRKNFDNQEVCSMKGVYYKNMKWQAAIKVDKKQIHLGTVRSQKEAACLYDRAAFLCGREPNFELTTKEKEELSKLSWEEFLNMTRLAINNKKNQRRIISRTKFENHEQNNSHSEAEADQGRNDILSSDNGDTF